MSITITMSSKGQFTLPADIRKAMALTKPGDKLVLDFSSMKRQVVLSRPTSLEEIQKKAQAYVQPGTKPLLDVDAFYNNRETS